MNDRITPSCLYLLLLAASLPFIGSLWAAQDEYTDGKDYSKEPPPLEKSWCQTPSPLEIRIGLPAWLAGVSGDSGIKGIVTSSDIGFDQLLSHFTHVPLALAVDARYQRWEFFGDGLYMEVGTAATLPGLLFTDAKVHLKFGIAEAFVGYRVINCDKASLSLFAGARYTYVGGDLNIFDNGDARLVILRQLLGIPKKLDFSASTDWVDPVLGARGKIRIWKAISLYAEGDVGGFDANADSAYELRRERLLRIRREPVDSSDWSYQVQGGIEVQLTRHIWTQAGWRYLKYDYQQAGFTNKTAWNGPFLQTGLKF